MDIKLQVIQGATSLQEVRLRRPRTVVGRKKGCKIRIRSQLVSRIHCSLVTQGGRLVVKDLGSSNGTFVNGLRIQEAALQAGDTLQVGPIKFLVQIIGVPSPTERPATVPAPTKAVPIADDEVVFLESDGEDSVGDEDELVEPEAIDEDEAVTFVRPEEAHGPVPATENIFAQDDEPVLNADDFVFNADSPADASGYRVADDARTDPRKQQG